MLQAIRTIISARHAAASATRILVPLSVALLVVASQPALEERFFRAQNYFAQSGYRSAVLELKDATQKRSDYAAARLLLVEALYQLGDFATAETGETSAAKSIVDELLASGASFSSRIQARQLVETL